MSADAPPAGTRRRGAAHPWDERAEWWKATFTAGADPEYEAEILPIVERELAGSRRVLDVGCGEGQVARRLVSSGGGRSAVVGVDPSAAQVVNALAAGGGPRYLQAEGERLPFARASFDAVVCCLVIEHAREADALLEEVARVLEPGGRFLLLVNHPLYQGPGSGFVDDQILGERYWRVGPYLTEGVSTEEVDAGVRIDFAHRPLSRYVNPLAAHDLLLTSMEEPAPLAEFLATSVDPALEGAIPRLLVLRFEHRPRGGRIAPGDRAGEERGGRWPST